MYAICFFRETMEHRFISAGIELEDDSEVVTSTRVGHAENISLLIEVQIGVRVCAGQSSWETVQNCESAQRSYFENGAVVVSSTLIRSPIKISFLVPDQSSIGVLTVRATTKAIFHSLVPSCSHFEHHTASVDATVLRGAIGVVRGIEN